MIKGIFQLAALAGFMLLPCFGYSQAPVLGASSNFALFSSNGAVTNTGLSQLTGNVGTNNGPVTNFGNVDGVMHNSDGATATAAADLTIAYNQLNAAIPTFFLASLLGNGQVLNAGIYAVGGGATLSNTLTLDGQGNSNAIFIFQVGGAMSSGAASRVLLTNGAQACNVFWKVEGAVSFATNSSFKGTLVANNSAIVLSEGATIEGRALSTTGAITVSGVTVTTPLGCGRPVLNGPAAPPLATVACYTLFSGNGAVTNTGVSFITGDVGTNVGLATGFQALNVTGTVHPIADVSTAQTAADLGTVYTYLNTLPKI